MLDPFIRQLYSVPVYICLCASSPFVHASTGGVNSTGVCMHKGVGCKVWVM